MTLITQTDIKTLAETQQPYCISLYMPTHRGGPEVRQDPIRFKNLIQDAREQLMAKQVSEEDADALLKPLNPLFEDAAFWQHQSDGLAVFLQGENLQTYRLPLQFYEFAVVSDRFHLKPLLPMLTENRRFYILALSQNQVQLFQATRYNITPVKLAGVPQNIEEFLQYDDPERQVQFHGGGNASPIYHGQGATTAEDKKKNDILRYFQQLDNGLRDILQGQEVPVVLAGVEYLLSLYRDANTYLQP
ncbi:MAG: hypothetical protein F6K03_17010 [Kamptonema sp. SIO4C4]|nr:hypothetical protein [Kamptonema sp. SIO4C4]